MTLREFGQSIVDWWNSYLIEITTQNVLDWSLWHLVLTIVGGAIGFSLIMGLVGAVVVVVFTWLASAWEKTGLPYTMERLDKRFGPFVSGLIMAVGTFAFLAAVGLLLALLESR